VKLAVTQLGRITHADLEIKPLTIFIGKNNTNKTWTAYALYGILRSLSWFKWGGFPSSLQNTAQCESLDTAVKNIIDRSAERLVQLISAGPQSAGPGQPSLTFDVTREDILKEANLGSIVRLSLSDGTLGKVLAVSSDALASSRVDVELSADDFRSAGKNSSLTFVIDKQQSNITVQAAQPNGHRLNVLVSASISDQLTVESIREQISPYVRWLAYAIYFDAMAFPAERKAISALISVLDPEEVRTLLPVPTNDFIQLMLHARRAPLADQTLQKLARLLEEKILNGRVDFQGPPEQRVLNYRSPSGHDLAINSVASLVRSLAGLDIYLRHHVREVIVIDEPEMNSHPEAQLQLIELFAMLVNHGVKLILTTHSPYLLDHLNNLVEAAKLTGDARTSIASKTKLGDEGAFIPIEKVAAYHFQENGAVLDLVSDGIIDVKSFASESDYVANLFNDIQSELVVSDGSGQEDGV
jgi:hypothetical protein